MRVLDAQSVDWERTDHGETNFRRKHLSANAAAAESSDDPELGCSLYELPPGSKSWPYHYHEGNAEALYVLDGAGQVRHDGERYSIDAGSYVRLPEGSAGAHRVLNDSETVLRYLAMSTMREPDVTVYPDSDKLGVFGGSPPGGRSERTVSGYYRRDDAVEYWTDEE